jgi:hypothetical protein
MLIHFLLHEPALRRIFQKKNISGEKIPKNLYGSRSGSGQKPSRLELKEKFSFSYFRENFRFSHPNLTKSRENNCKYIYNFQK